MPRLLISAISLFLVLILGGFLIWPKYQDFRELQKEIEDKRIELRNREEYFLDLERISEKLKEYSDSLSKIDSALPPDPDLPSLFAFLKKVSAQNGLFLKEITPVSVGSPGEIPTIKESYLNLSLLGSYASFKNFLSSLYKSARLFEPESISFLSPEEEGIFNFELKIKVYSY